MAEQLIKVTKQRCNCGNDYVYHIIDKMRIPPQSFGGRGSSYFESSWRCQTCGALYTPVPGNTLTDEITPAEQRFLNDGCILDILSNLTVKDFFLCAKGRRIPIPKKTQCNQRGKCARNSSRHTNSTHGVWSIKNPQPLFCFGKRWAVWTVCFLKKKNYCAQVKNVFL